jgi:hypothetical protein
MEDGRELACTPTEDQTMDERINMGRQEYRALVEAIQLLALDPEELEFVRDGSLMEVWKHPELQGDIELHSVKYDPVTSSYNGKKLVAFCGKANFFDFPYDTDGIIKEGLPTHELEVDLEVFDFSLEVDKTVTQAVRFIRELEEDGHEVQAIRLDGRSIEKSDLPEIE